MDRTTVYHDTAIYRKRDNLRDESAALVTTSVPVWKNVSTFESQKKIPFPYVVVVPCGALGPRRPPSTQSRGPPFIYEQYFRNRYRFPVYFVFVSRSLRSTDKNETSLERYNSVGGKGLHRSAVKREATWNVAGLFLRGKRATRVKGWDKNEEDGNEEHEEGTRKTTIAARRTSPIGLESDICHDSDIERFCPSFSRKETNSQTRTKEEVTFIENTHCITSFAWSPVRT